MSCLLSLLSDGYNEYSTKIERLCLMNTVHHCGREQKEIDFQFDGCLFGYEFIRSRMFH